MSNVTTDIPKGMNEDNRGFVCIQYKISKLKQKHSGPPPVAKNADITDTSFNEWGFSAFIRGHQKGEMKDKVYNPFIRKLPHEIVENESYFTISDEFFYVWLKKKDQSLSWEHYFREDQLETADGN